MVLAMSFIKRLKIILRYDDVSGLLIYLIPSIIFILLSNIYSFVLIFYILYQIYLFRRSRILFFYSLSISLFLLLIYFVYYLIYKTYEPAIYLKGVIVEKDDNSFLLKEGLHYIKIYYNDTKNLIIGKHIEVKGEKYEIIERNIESTFSHFRYNLSKRIISEYIASDIKMNEKSFSIYSIKSFIFEYIDKNYYSESKMYIERLVFGKSSFSDELNESINNIGIIYLFAISGLHISILSLLIKKFLRIFNIEEEIITVVLIIMLIIYYFITSISSSVTRAIIMTIITEISKLLNRRIPKIDTLVHSFIISLMINPFYIYQMGFYLTYLSTLIIYLSKEKNLLKLTFLVVLFSTPLILYNNQKISIFILINSLVFGSLFSVAFIPFTYIVLIISPLDFIYKGFINVLNSSIIFSSEIDVPFYFSIENIYFLLIIYFLLFIIINRIKDKKKYKSFIALVVLVFMFNYFTSIYSFFPRVIVLDVGQGDSILIRNGFDNYLIDTGVYDKYNTTVKYLNKRNIYKLNIVFISHDDSDHMGDIENLSKVIKIDKIIDGTKEIDLNIKGLHFKSYRLNSENKNEGSMVLYLKMYNASFLFTGDIESMGEDNILKTDIHNITYLKVAHHGSKTSSKKEFIDKMHPKVSFISVGLNNKYGHPASEVLKRLESVNSKIYRTDMDGSIEVTILPYISFIKTYRKDELSIFERLDNHRVIIH